jgi:uncharacterized Tic20 family protein
MSFVAPAIPPIQHEGRVAPPPGYAPGPPPASMLTKANTRLRDESISDGDRTYAIFIHLSPFAFIIGIGPLALLLPVLLWVVRKDDSAFHDDHGREVINFGLSLFLFHLMLAISVIGLVLLPVLWVVAIVNLCRAAIAAGRSEYFRYPMTIRFLS